MKKLSISFIALAAVAALTGCLKDKPNTDFSTISPILEISNASNNPVAQAPSAGYAYFSAATLFLTGLEQPDTISFTVNLASDYPLKKDINYTLAVDEAALADLNANTTTNAKKIQYALFSTDQAVLTRTQGTIKAGTRLDTIQVIFYPDKIDPTKSFALPISIKTVDDNGVTISGNMGTIYFHQIGNPIAGVYTWDFERRPNNTGAGAPDGQSFSGESIAFVPDDATTVEMTSGYLDIRYVLTFTNTNGVLSDFAVTQNDIDLANVKANYTVTVTQPPKILIADPATKTYKFQYVVFNGSAYRWNVDTYHIP